MQHALGTAFDWCQPVGQGQDADDFTKSQCHDGQVITTQPQHREAQDQPPDYTDQDAERQCHPEVEISSSQWADGGQDTHRIRTESEESHVPQVKQSGIANHDVQTQAHHHE